MHEFSVAESILSFCGREREKQQAEEIRAVHLLIGVMSGIDIQLLREAFEALKHKRGFAKTELLTRQEEISVACGQCGAGSRLMEMKFVCPECGSENVRIAGGDKMLIEKIDLVRQKL